MLFKFVQRENKTLYIDRSQTTHKPKIIYKWNGVSKTARPEKPEVTGINETEGYGTDCQEQVQVWHVYCYRSYINSIPLSFFFSQMEMATHSGILAWKIPGTEEPGRLQSMGSHRVRHNWATDMQHKLQWNFQWYRELWWYLSFLVVDTLFICVCFLSLHSSPH